MKALEINHLHKYFDHHHVLNDVNLSINQGEIFNLVGANGCGKSALLQVLAGLETKTSGNISLFDQPISQQVAQINHRVAYVNQDVFSYTNLTGTALINKSVSQTDEHSRITELISLFQFDPDKAVQLYSHAEQARLAIILTLLRKADVYLFDEPFTNLDPQNIAHLQKELVKLKRHGKTILLVTNDLAPAEKSADHFGIMRDGSIIEQGQLTDLHYFNDVDVTITTAIPVEIPVGQISVANFEYHNYHQVSFTVNHNDLNQLITLLAKYQIDNLTVTRSSRKNIFN